LPVLWALLAGAATAASNGSSHDTTALDPGNPASGRVEIDVTDILGNDLASRVVFRPQGAETAKPFVVEAPQGRANHVLAAGAYEAYIHVYESGVPILVDVQRIIVEEGRTAYVPLNLAEGRLDDKSLWECDHDFDLAINIAEIRAGTDPTDPSSVPGHRQLRFESRALDKEPGWRRGELHAKSMHGGGKEPVGKLIKRAEKAGLDFLAITDRNTMAACEDPDFQSDNVVLIPAMEWGSDAMGVALIYAPGTYPPPPDTPAVAQAVAIRVQAQGGFFAVGHPCFPNAPWQWAVGEPNAVEVWCRDWVKVPPITRDVLRKDLFARRDGKVVNPIAVAASTTEAVSANSQAVIFWDRHLAMGSRVGIIAGSMSASRRVPLGEPITYVYTAEKSLRAILDGLRWGRTFISAGPDGPEIAFEADVLNDGRTDVIMGGVIPLHVETRFIIAVKGAKGKKLQVMCNGRPVVSKVIESDSFVNQFSDEPRSYSVYYARVVVPTQGSPAEGVFTPLEVLAMTSPIYAQQMIVTDKDPEQIWISLQDEENLRDTGGRVTGTGRELALPGYEGLWVRPDIDAEPWDPSWGQEITPQRLR